jgi:hypothetical protein
MPALSWKEKAHIKRATHCSFRKEYIPNLLNITLKLLVSKKNFNIYINQSEEEFELLSLTTSPKEEVYGIFCLNMTKTLHTKL